MRKIVIGNPVLIEVTIDKYPPFGTLAADDPEVSVKITITNPAGSVMVNAQSMLKNDTGEYYYIYQTTSSSILGEYHCTIIADGTSYDSAYITEKLFELVSNND
jgi:hypothetical protein